MQVKAAVSDRGSASRLVIVLSVVGAAMLIGMATLHGSGYSYVAGAIEGSQLSGFLKRVLPSLYLYPSALLALLALFVLGSLRMHAGRSVVLALVGTLVAANSIFGFVLGGVVPGGVLLLAAGMLGWAARAAWGDARR